MLKNYSYHEITFTIAKTDTICQLLKTEHRTNILICFNVGTRMAPSKWEDSFIQRINSIPKT